MKKIISSILSLTLASCAQIIGPDHTVPDATLPDRWSTGGSSFSSLQTHWWRLFGDAELNRLQTLALGANQDLVAAMHRVDEARADFQTARADLLPALSAGGSAERSQSSANATQIPGFAPAEVSQYRLKSNLSYELDLWGKVRRSVESKRASLEATAFARDAVLLRLTGEVGGQYFQLRTLDAEKALLDQTIALRKESLGITRTKFEGGLTSKSDLTRAQSQLASAEADVADIIRRRSLVENTLAELCGQSAGGFRVTARAALQSSVPSVPLSSPATLLRQRPDIAECERTLAARNAEIGVAMGGRLPSVKLNGSLNMESLTLGDLLSSGSRAFSIGPELSLPVFTGGANRARVEKAKARHAQAASEYRGIVLAAVKEVEDAITNQRGYGAQAERQETNAASAAETTKLSLERYTKGVVNYLEVVDAQREELQARRDLVQARGNRLVATVQLMKALGGGWK
jgi:outer membrane protein, multidrug efflux system